MEHDLRFVRDSPRQERSLGIPPHALVVGLPRGLHKLTHRIRTQYPNPQIRRLIEVLRVAAAQEGVLDDPLVQVRAHVASHSDPPVRMRTGSESLSASSPSNVSVSIISPTIPRLHARSRRPA